jgi:hypothetical protein
MACEPKPCLARFASRSDVGGSWSGEVGAALRKGVQVAKHLFEQSIHINIEMASLSLQSETCLFGGDLNQ